MIVEFVKQTLRVAPDSYGRPICFVKGKRRGEGWGHNYLGVIIQVQYGAFTYLLYLVVLRLAQTHARASV